MTDADGRTARMNQERMTDADDWLSRVDPPLARQNALRAAFAIGSRGGYRIEGKPA
jgi:hypothetical protein